MTHGPRSALHRGRGRGPAVLLGLLLLVPPPAAGAPPLDAPLPERPPAVGTAGAAPQRTPRPVRRPRAEPAPGAPAGLRPAPADAGAPVAVPRPAPSPQPAAVAAAPLPPPRPALGGSALIGIFSLTTGRTALLRYPTGDVRRVSVGDELDGWRVNSITADTLRVTRAGRERTLLLSGN